LRRENDQTNRARADNEAENKRIADTRVMYDGLLMDNHKLNDYNQSLNHNLLKSSAELKEAYEKRSA